MSNKKIIRLIAVAIMVLALTFTTAGAQVGKDLGPDGLPGADTTPLPLYPNAKVYDLTPTFHFSQLYDATNYKIEVWNDFTDVLVYTYKGVTCQAAGVPCELTPDVKLKAFNYTETMGLYRWRVKAKIEGKWQLGYSSEQTFTVMSPGFNHSFITLPSKWKQLWGVWTITKAGYLKTPGEPGEYASVMHKELFEDTDLHPMFEVVMKRKIETERQNGILMGGLPGDSPRNGWLEGYQFTYANAGTFEFLYRKYDGVFKGLCLGDESDSINEYGWNKLTIWQHYPYVTAWINEDMVCNEYVPDDMHIFRSGYLGIMEIGYPDSAFLVDSAKLEYRSTPPYLIPDSVESSVGD